MNRSTIEWTEATWNPTTGCRKVSPGCDHCYAATLARRLKAMGSPRYQNDGPDGPGFALTVHPDKLEEPSRWRKPQRVFVNSMSDLFHSDVPSVFIAAVFDTMGQCPQHTFQILTKRPKRMQAEVRRIAEARGLLRNVWLGVSIESDDFVWRADWLRATPAAVRFVSLEPLLGQVSSLSLDAIDWVIVGGESGARARPPAAAWIRTLRDRCVRASVPFFFKQWGGRNPRAGGNELDGRTWLQFPVAAEAEVSLAIPAAARP